MKKGLWSAILGLTLIAGCSHKPNKPSKPLEKIAPTSRYQQPVQAEELQILITDWPKVSREAINVMIEKYGMPHEATTSHLVWNNTAPFKRSIVYRDPIKHDFPNPHVDVLEQVIDYKIPDGKIEEILGFSGSLIIDKTRGELASRAEREEMNILSLNLADRIVRGEMPVTTARTQFANSVSAFNLGNNNQYVSGLLVVPTVETSNPDRTVKPGLIRERMQAQEFDPSED